MNVPHLRTRRHHHISHPFSAHGSVAVLLAAALASSGVPGCAASPAAGDGAIGSGSGGSGGSGTPDATPSIRDAAVDATVPGPARPPAPGAGDLPRPTGAPGGLRVLDWAGFKSALTYTFDDAQPSQLEHYAQLQAVGVPLTFFITSANNYQAGFDTTFTQAVRDGHEMGNHSVHHCQANLTNCSTGAAPSLDAEIDGCTDYIVGHFGQGDVWTAASPYGDTGYDAPDTNRFFLNRGVGSGTIGPNDATDPFNLPCHAAVDNETAASFNTAIDAAHTAGRWVIMLVHTLTPTTSIWYAPIDISVIADSAAHAQSLGDVWIDSMVNVGAYWRAQKIVGAATPTTSGASQTWRWALPAHFPPGRFLRVTVSGGVLSQGGSPLTWDGHGYYEISLDAGSVTLSPE